MRSPYDISLEIMDMLSDELDDCEEVTEPLRQQIQWLLDDWKQEMI